MAKNKIHTLKPSLCKGTNPRIFQSIKTAKRFINRNRLRYLANYRSNTVITQTFINAYSYIRSKA